MRSPLARESSSHVAGTCLHEVSTGQGVFLTCSWDMSVGGGGGGGGVSSGQWVFIIFRDGMNKVFCILYSEHCSCWDVSAGCALLSCSLPRDTRGWAAYDCGLWV